MFQYLVLLPVILFVPKTMVRLPAGIAVPAVAGKRGCAAGRMRRDVYGKRGRSAPVPAVEPARPREIRQIAFCRESGKNNREPSFHSCEVLETAVLGSGTAQHRIRLLGIAKITGSQVFIAARYFPPRRSPTGRALSDLPTRNRGNNRDPGFHSCEVPAALETAVLGSRPEE